MRPATLSAPSPASARRGVRETALNPRDRSPAELGRRIKMLRVARELTLKDIETRGGISATHVSEIERGKASPTVGALGKIAAALGMRPASIVAPRLLPEVTVRRASRRSEGAVRWSGASIGAASDPIQDAELGLHLFTLPIGREPAIEHRHDGEEWLTVLSGVAEVRIEGRAFVMREGDSLHFHGTRTHAYANLGSSPAVLLIASHPRLAI